MFDLQSLLLIHLLLKQNLVSVSVTLPQLNHVLLPVPLLLLQVQTHLLDPLLLLQLLVHGHLLLELESLLLAQFLFLDLFDEELVAVPDVRLLLVMRQFQLARGPRLHCLQEQVLDVGLLGPLDLSVVFFLQKLDSAVLLNELGRAPGLAREPRSGLERIHRLLLNGLESAGGVVLVLSDDVSLLPLVLLIPLPLLGRVLDLLGEPLPFESQQPALLLFPFVELALVALDLLLELKPLVLLFQVLLDLLMVAPHVFVEVRVESQVVGVRLAQFPRTKIFLTRLRRRHVVRAGLRRRVLHGGRPVQRLVDLLLRLHCLHEPLPLSDDGFHGLQEPLVVVLESELSHLRRHPWLLEV